MADHYNEKVGRSFEDGLVAAERPLETYSPDELLDMLRVASEEVFNSNKRWTRIRNAVQNKLERTNEEYSKVLAYHSEKMNGPEEAPEYDTMASPAPRRYL